MNKQQLASTIWESANQMRSKIEPNEYKDFILGFIFYKYLSEKEVLLFRGMGFSDEEIKNLSENDAQSVEHAKKTLGYFISYKDLFSTWLSMGKDFDVSNVRDALSAFDRNIDDTYKKVYEKIFNTLQTGLSKLGDTAQAQTKAIKALLKLIKESLWMESRIMMCWDLSMNILSACLQQMQERKLVSSTHLMRCLF